MKPVNNLRWWIGGLLFLATAINYIDRQTLSVLAPLLREKFGMSNTDYSAVLTAFMLSYTVMQSGFGRIMDRLGTKRGFSLAIAWWSVAAVLHALANSARQFGFCRLLLGAGEAGNWPGGVKAVAEWFPAKSRALAIGFFNSGSSLGAVTAPPAVAWITLEWGWRAAFVFTGLLGFLWLAAWVTVYHQPRSHPRISPAELRLIQESQSTRPDSVSSALAPGERWLTLFGHRQVWGLVLSRLLADPVWWFYVFWLPEYLTRERHFNLQMIGYFCWIPFLTGGVGNFAGGWLSGHLIRRGRPVLASRGIVMFLSAAIMVAGIPAVLTRDSFLSLALISVATFAYSCWAVNILTLPADLFPSARVASVSGLSGTGGAAGGMAFTLLIGYVLDRFSYLPVFVAAGLMPLMAASIIIWGIRPGPVQEERTA
ncbi:MAG TPA: MFS transporter [Terriglobia bacterium]|nr:MFS transporter [Terriglobia bacterium]